LLGAHSLLLTAAVFHEFETVNPSFKISDDGLLKLTKNVSIRGIMLKKGLYIVEHRIQRASHVFTFIEISTAKSNFHATEKPIDIFTITVLPAERVSRSIIHAKEQKNGSFEIQVIQLAGEDLVHTF
jgi:hypothetical protein